MKFVLFGAALMILLFVGALPFFAKAAITIPSILALCGAALL